MNNLDFQQLEKLLNGLGIKGFIKAKTGRIYFDMILTLVSLGILTGLLVALFGQLRDFVK